MQWYKKLHWQIIVALVLGLLYGVIGAAAGWRGFTYDWIAPFGTIFLRLLKLIAMPLVLTSLITGVASLSDMRKLSRMGGKTITIYIATTAVAVTIGLVVVNAIQPGHSLPAETRAQLEESFAADVAGKFTTAESVKERAALQPLVDIVPDNFFGSAGDNSNMLQMVFFALLVGVAIVQLPKNRSKPVLDVLQGLTEAVINMVRIIMYIAPIGVFALIADTVTDLAQDDPRRVLDLIKSLGVYAFCVILGLAIHMTCVYLGLLKALTPIKLGRFFAGIAPAQLLAFSTSSSGATLPMTMKCCEEELGVSEEVSSFVLPLGATINMDGTALYQAVAAVFIAQAGGIDLSMVQQLNIVLLAVLASIGTAAVPGAGMVMLIIILEGIGVPAMGIALIAGVDRILDMCRTVTNITGDSAVACVIANSEAQLQPSPAAGEGG